MEPSFNEAIVVTERKIRAATIIINAAKEPEVIQLCEVLKDAGLNIKGIGTDTLAIEGTAGELLDFKPFDIKDNNFTIS